MPKTPPDLDAIFTAELALPGSWDLRTSLPVPTVWPLTPGPTLVTYAAALGDSDSPTLFEYTGLLARVVHDPTERLSPTYERLATTIEALSFTATQPISSATIEAIQKVPGTDAIYLALASGDPKPELETWLRARWRFFEHTHGWLAEQLVPLHGAFFAWLGAVRS